MAIRTIRITNIQHGIINDQVSDESWTFRVHDWIFKMINEPISLRLINIQRGIINDQVSDESWKFRVHDWKFKMMK